MEILLIILIALVGDLLESFFVMTLWNYFMPVVCNFNTITFWQSFWLCVMMSLLTYHYTPSKK